MLINTSIVVQKNNAYYIMVLEICLGHSCMSLEVAVLVVGLRKIALDSYQYIFLCLRYNNVLTIYTHNLPTTYA